MLDAAQIAARARAGEAPARSTLERYARRLGGALAGVVNLLDPDVVVLGGGLSNIDELYEPLRRHLAANLFSDACRTPVRRNLHGDASGVRGAAWLWPAA
jgi:fructokinase